MQVPRLYCFIAFGVFMLLLYAFAIHSVMSQQDDNVRLSPPTKFELPNNHNATISDYNIWLIFTNVKVDSPLKHKFSDLVINLLNVSTVPLKFHVIVDEMSQQIATLEFKQIANSTEKEIVYFFYNIQDVVTKIQGIVSILTPHFSTPSGMKYSGALFYISLGLHQIAPVQQELAILLDCDLYFKDDVALLFKEFFRFKSTALFGLAPELSPVYRNALRNYRATHETTFGDFYHSSNISTDIHPYGFPGYNSGVVLLNLQKIRHSKEYPKLFLKSVVDALTKKYKFRGFLGDQDFYTLLGFEHPDLIQT